MVSKDCLNIDIVPIWEVYYITNLSSPFLLFCLIFLPEFLSLFSLNIHMFPAFVVPFAFIIQLKNYITHYIRRSHQKFMIYLILKISNHP